MELGDGWRRIGGVVVGCFDGYVVIEMHMRNRRGGALMILGKVGAWGDVGDGGLAICSRGNAWHSCVCGSLGAR